MRFSYALVALISLANALPTENNVEQRAAGLSQRDVEDRGVADAAYLAELDARAEGFQLEERKKKAKNATAKAAKAAAAAAAASARSIDVEDRGVADAAYLAELDARAEGFQLEERKKKAKNATAKAAKAAAAAAAAAARSIDVEDRSVADAAYLAELDARAEGFQLEERKKKAKNATAKAAKAAAAAAAATARSIDVEDRSVADAAYLAELDARAEGFQLEERKKKAKNATAKAAKAAAAAATAQRSVELDDRTVSDPAYLAERELEERKSKKNQTAKAAAKAAKAAAAAAANTQKRSVNLFDEVNAE